MQTLYPTEKSIFNFNTTRYRQYSTNHRMNVATFLRQCPDKPFLGWKIPSLLAVRKFRIYALCDHKNSLRQKCTYIMRPVRVIKVEPFN